MYTSGYRDTARSSDTASRDIYRTSRTNALLTSLHKRLLSTCSLFLTILRTMLFITTFIVIMRTRILSRLVPSTFQPAYCDNPISDLQNAPVSHFLSIYPQRSFRALLFGLCVDSSTSMICHKLQPYPSAQQSQWVIWLFIRVVLVVNATVGIII